MDRGPRYLHNSRSPPRPFPTRPDGSASQTLAGDAAVHAFQTPARGCHPVFPHGGFLRDVLRRRQGGGGAAGPDPDDAEPRPRQRRGAAGGSPPPRGRPLRRQTRADGEEGRHLRAGRRSKGSQGHRQAGRRAGGVTRHRPPRFDARRAQQQLHHGPGPRRGCEGRRDLRRPRRGRPVDRRLCARRAAGCGGGGRVAAGGPGGTGPRPVPRPGLDGNRRGQLTRSACQPPRGLAVRAPARLRVPDRAARSALAAQLRLRRLRPGGQGGRRSAGVPAGEPARRRRPHQPHSPPAPQRPPVPRRRRAAASRAVRHQPGKQPRRLPHRDPRLHPHRHGGAPPAPVARRAAARRRGDREPARRRGCPARIGDDPGRGSPAARRHRRSRTPGRAHLLRAGECPGPHRAGRFAGQGTGGRQAGAATAAAGRPGADRTGTGAVRSSRHDRARRPDRRRPRRRSARVDRRGRSLPRRVRRGARRTPGDPVRGKELDRAPPGRRAGTHRHRLAEGRFQPGVRLLHRGQQGEPRTRPRRLRAQADPGQCRTLRHPRPERARSADSQRHGAHRRAREPAFRRAPRTRFQVGPRGAGVRPRRKRHRRAGGPG